MEFEIVGEISDVETIAVGSSIREVIRLRRVYGRGRWRKLKGEARVQLADGRIRLAEIHWYEAHGIGKKESNESGFWTRDVTALGDSIRFAVCVDNDGYPASLELHKIYRVLPDEGAVSDGDLRVIDESGEDYFYPSERLVLLELPQSVENSLLQNA